MPTEQTKQAKVEAQRSLLEAAETEQAELEAEHSTATEALAERTRELNATSPNAENYRQLKQARTDAWTAMNEAEGRVTDARRRVEGLSSELERLEQEATR